MKNIKIATFNVNNLFERARVMDLRNFSKEGKEVLADVSNLNNLLGKSSYAGSTGKEIIRILEKYFHEQNSNPWFTINDIREKLFSRNRDGSGLKLKARGREDWLGWVELTKHKTNEICVDNTGRVIDAVDPHILCMVEVDNRNALTHFNNTILKTFGKNYKHAMLIDGNDDRGIDVGLLSRFPIGQMVSHVDDTYKDGNNREQPIFSRDCPEYTVHLSETIKIHMLCNHLKSKGYGKPAESNQKRKRQATRVAEILRKYDLKKDFVVVAGDFNDTPDSAPLQPLIKHPDLHDVLGSKKFSGPRWTYHTGKDQIDYLLVSEALYKKIDRVGIERRGISRKNNPSFKEVTNHVTQASDHACVWATFNL